MKSVKNSENKSGENKKNHENIDILHANNIKKRACEGSPMSKQIRFFTGFLRI